MTDDRMVLVELIEQGADSDLVREMPAFAAARMMDPEIEARTGAPVTRRTAEKALAAVIREACVHGVSTRPVDDPVKAMDASGVSKGQVSRMVAGISTSG